MSRILTKIKPAPEGWRYVLFERVETWKVRGEIKRNEGGVSIVCFAQTPEGLAASLNRAATEHDDKQKEKTP